MHPAASQDLGFEGEITATHKRNPIITKGHWACSRVRRRPRFGGIARRRWSTSLHAIALFGDVPSVRDSNRCAYRRGTSATGAFSTRSPSQTFATGFAPSIGLPGLPRRGRSSRNRRAKPHGSSGDRVAEVGELALEVSDFQHVVNLTRFLAVRRNAMDDVEVVSGTPTLCPHGRRRQPSPRV
jgi:hypothetical protein